MLEKVRQKKNVRSACTTTSPLLVLLHRNLGLDLLPIHWHLKNHKEQKQVEKFEEEVLLFTLLFLCVCVCMCVCVCVCVYISRARSNEARRSTASVFRRHEQHKRRLYDQRVRDVEMASFTPLVFAASGGFGPSARVTFKRLASRLAAKLAMPYSAVMGWLRCRVSFSLLRSAVMCLRGSRQHVRGDVGCPALAIAEGHF